MDINSIYYQLTSVDINMQKAIWDERGKGYYGEYLLFCELYKHIPGNGKILMNLNVPVNETKTTEIDLVLIHESGIYVFEIKHYKGTIFGMDTDEYWTQYFRTSKNSIFNNPVHQNEYHINALRQLFPDVPLYSCIVFTSPDCDLKTENKNHSADICRLSEIKSILDLRFSLNGSKYTMQEIDEMFNQLSIYSQMLESPSNEAPEACFLSWIEPTITELERTKKVLENEREYLAFKVDKLKNARLIYLLSAIAVMILCICISIFSINAKANEYNYKLSLFEQKFMHIDAIDNPYIDSLNSYVTISKIELKPSTDDTVTFKARISIANSMCGIALTEESKYIVMTRSGMVFEYNVFGKHLNYNRSSNTLGNGIRAYGDLAKIYFYGIGDVNEIVYIKMTGIDLIETDRNRTVIKDSLEIELYSAVE